MNAITSRLPVKLPARLARGRLARVSVLNGVLGALLVGAATAAYLTVGQNTASTTATTRTATVARGVVLSTVSATGALQPAKQLSVNFTSSGELLSVNVNVGQHVKAGQLLGRIDSTSAGQGVLQAEASLTTARAQYQATLTGETSQQRAQDAVSVTQARQSVTNAKTSLAATGQSIALDKRTSAASLTQANQQLRVDQGQIEVDIAKLKTDSVTYVSGDAATAAVNADKSRLANDQAKQQTDQQSQLTWQQQQASDQAGLKTAQTNNDTAGIAQYTNATNYDQGALNALAKVLQVDGFASTQDQSQLSTDTSAQGALTSDQSAIKNDEQKIAQDNSSIANVKNSQAATKLKDAQSLGSARQQVASAQLGLRSTLAGNALKQAPATPSAVAGGRASVLQAGIALTNARKTLAQTSLRAPIAGVVAAVSGTPGTQISGSGTTASTSSSASSSTVSSSGSGSSSSSSSGFVTLTGLKGMQVVAGFAETDAAKIRPDQAATVTVDALPNQQFAAHVLAVAGTSTTSSSVVTYNVTFALDHGASQLKSGMTANVSVVTGEADNVLNVPTAAVSGSGNNATVTVLRNGQKVSVPVVVGLQGDSSTAILSGLKQTDTIVLPTVSIASSSSTSGTGTTGATTGSRTRGGGGFSGFGGGGFTP